jgi:APA family basic amino acid/polyamine antiporter
MGDPQDGGGPAAAGPLGGEARGSVSPAPLPRRLSVWSTAAVLVGSTIGSGIFRVPSVAAGEGGTLGAVALLWTAGALLTLFGALTVAELAALFPRAGGIYVYLWEAFGPFPAFLFGWTRLLVIEPALLGGIGLVFAAYAGTFAPLTDLQVRGVAILAILLVGAANYRSLLLGAWIQNISTAAKVVALVGLALVIFTLGDPAGGAMAGSVRWAPERWSSAGIALISVLWAYDGWADATYVAGEVKDPERSLPRALLGGFGVVVAVYLLLNAAYLYVLPLEDMAASELVAARASSLVLGWLGGGVVAALVLLSTFGALNGTMMSGPRVFFALGQDGLFFRRIGAVHPRGKTPHVAILLATALGIGYVSVRSFEELAEAFILGLWPFYMMAVLAVFRLRTTRPELPRPYRTWGYPWVPGVFLAVSLAMVLNALLTQPSSTLFSLGIIASGVPVYWGWRRCHSSRRTT